MLLFMLLEVVLVGVLVGCQVQGLDLEGRLWLGCFIYFIAFYQCLDRPDMEKDPEKRKHFTLIFIANLVFGLLNTLRW